VVVGGGFGGLQAVRESGALLDRGGRVSVGPDLTLAGHPGVFAVGDMVRMHDRERTPARPFRCFDRIHLIGPQNRLLVTVRWTFSYLTRSGGAQVITGPETSAMRRTPTLPEETTLRR
jgi:hypothetical protein